MEGETFAVFSGEFLHALERDGGGIIEIIDNYGGVTAGKQLKHRVTTDVSSTAGYQNVLGHHHLRELSEGFMEEKQDLFVCKRFKRNVYCLFVNCGSSEKGFWSFIDTEER
uniref:Uncharacterized protein n=2 Tax=Noccaea caerulescens TaxID=107243 RepID=A0A1J3GL36_NOCCA